MAQINKGLTKNHLIQAFRKIGVGPGMELEVHSSLSSFGYVHGGAETVVDALMEAVGDSGTIIMSAFPISKNLPLSDFDKTLGITTKIKKYPEDHNLSSGMGIVSDTFQKRSGVKVGTGLYRMAAWGKDSEEHSKGLNRIIADGGYALMLGVDIYRLTSMHYMEKELPDEIHSLFKPSKETLKYYPEEEWLIESCKHPVKAWYKIQDEADSKGYIKWQRIGESRCMFFKINDVIRLYEKAIKNDPLKLYGLK